VLDIPDITATARRHRWLWGSQRGGGGQCRTNHCGPGGRYGCAEETSTRKIGHAQIPSGAMNAVSNRQKLWAPANVQAKID